MASNKWTEAQRFSVEHAHLNLDLSKIDLDRLKNPFRDYRSLEDYMTVLQAIRDPKNFYFTCKYILNIEPTVFQLVWLEQLWKYPFPMLIAGRGASKSFTIGLYYCLRGLITQGSKIIITSSSFRQAKFVFEYMENIWYNAPVLRDLCGSSSGPKRSTDVWNFRLGDSTCKAIPLGDGSKIRGLRANYIDVEEFNSVSEEIFEVVLRGFTATSSNPVENIKNSAKIKRIKELGLWTPEYESQVSGIYKPNQIILSGTSGFDFQHFSKYWKRYHAIIKSRGDVDKLRDALGGEPDKAFSHKDYCIIRIPIELLPEGMMDATAIANARATMDKGRFEMEFGTIFSKDSYGFFPRSLIESCVTKEPIMLPDGPVQFSAKMYGNPDCKYVMGVDPASESDNFSIVILELHKNHRRVVYVWTTNREKHYKRFTAKTVNENYFYGYINRKIRDLMKAFNVEYIALDSGGGGIEVMGVLHDLRRLETGEVPIWPIRQDSPIFWKGSKDYLYDDEFGLHCIEMVSMSKSEYVVFSNHGLKQDLENKMLLFPNIDSVSISVADNEDKMLQREYDTLEDCLFEIQECKEELSTISHTTTQNGTDRWDTPEIILTGNKRGRMRKDRYSSLMMANSLGRRMMAQSTIQYSAVPAGGFAHDWKDRKEEGALYIGADWFVSAANNSKLGHYVHR